MAPDPPAPQDAPRPGPAPGTVAALLAARAADDRPGLRFEDAQWSWREVVERSQDAARRALSLRRPGPFHIAVLLDNVPDYLFWIGGAAFAGAAVVGVNPTRRGAELARDIRHTDCQLLVTDREHLALLDGIDHGIPADRVIVVDGAGPAAGADPDAWRHEPLPDPAAIDPAAPLLLLFTSGTTGAPKAVICSQGRLAGIAVNVQAQYGITADDVTYQAMPLFHGNALMANWAPALLAGATVALRRKFSASGFLPDVRRFGATYFNYVGKCLTYILATPEQPDDADNPLRRCFGNEASAVDVAAFSQRFGCTIVEGYGSSEGGAVITRTPDTPPAALGVGRTDDVCIVDPETRRECPRAEFDDQGRFVNAAEAIGEIVNRAGAVGFEGYYRNDEATSERIRHGWYWSGDLGYRDAAGFFYFAGRNADWLWVDGENFAAAPVERILVQLPGVVAAAVYAVPDALAGDQCMVALEMRPGSPFDPDAFGAFLAAQPDLGTKWAPRYVRVIGEMPLTSTHKIVKQPMRRAKWEVGDPVYWREGRDLSYRLLTDADRRAIREEFAHHGRTAVLDL